MSEEKVETVRHMVDAWDRDDLDKAFAYLAPEVEFHTSRRFADEGVYRGRAGLERLLAEWREDLEGQRTSVSDVRVVGEDVVVVAALLTGRGRRSKAEFRERLWYVVRFRDGSVVRIETYLDSAHALEAAGVRE
jgi:ketosteroid isomerase-like protein